MERDIEKEKQIYNEAKEIVDKHKHYIVKEYESAKCDICGQDFGWWCPDSPDHVCDYMHINEEEVGIEFIGGYFDDDDCIYCHQPEERK